MTAKIFEVRLTEGAESDLETIHAYLAENRSDDAADALLEEFELRIETLERLPTRGAIPRELENLGIREFRQVLLGTYRIVYRISEAKVFVVLIADGRRDMEALLERRLLSR